ncbi:deoxyhypusine synthase [Candidatus Mancarchaeum acidiphilum]|uniref:Deoxyhypusine synthase n=1 Tax=Candidatus Mancarchaeum acidiphilum TaxID=1920749 RepID=A0A218NP13_9ARCH|nr:deoxyhypusine synthase [Candidatus Mancarchaeum acidiphilum]ASI14195.1 deoxyhypusine synthase [Candidatus Mancarchaeum acidiphilum]
MKGVNKKNLSEDAVKYEVNKKDRSKIAKQLLEIEVKDIRLKKDMKVSELISQMDYIGGFSAQHMVNGIHILSNMFNDKKCYKFLSFPADLVSTGLRGVLVSMVKHFDAIITTGGTLDHDLARAYGGRYSLGTFNTDDAMMHELGIYREGNVFIKNEEYGQRVEDAFNEIMNDIYTSKDYKKEYSPSELIYEFGKRMKDEKSIMRQAYLHNVKIFNPGIVDGAFGTQLTLFSQDHDFKLNVLKDELELSNIAFDNSVTGALMIGGGISKHHVIWWNQFKDGLDYAVYITTATQFDGSLSGARLSEAVSWGKIREKAQYMTIDGDATILLPFMMSALNIE